MRKLLITGRCKELQLLRLKKFVGPVSLELPSWQRTLLDVITLYLKLNNVLYFKEPLCIHCCQQILIMS